MPAGPFTLADLIIEPRGRGIPFSDVEPVPVEKSVPAGKTPPPGETTAGTEVPVPTPPIEAAPPESSSSSVYVGVFAIVVALVALFALIKRGSLAPRAAE